MKYIQSVDMKEKIKAIKQVEINEENRTTEKDDPVFQIPIYMLAN